MGSGDRRLVSDMVYSFYRLGRAGNDLSVDQKILIGIYLCHKVATPILEYFKPLWHQEIGAELPRKLALLKEQEGIDMALDNIFPYKALLSKGIDAKGFELSFLNQPKLFIRIRPGKKRSVVRKLKEANIEYTELDENCFSLQNSTKASDVLNIDVEAVIQDHSSQQAGIILHSKYVNTPCPKIAWDCCAGSGGKAIMVYDLFRGIKLTVSDKRKLILENLHSRFLKAGIKKYHSCILNLSDHGYKLPENIPKQYDLIICDAPCTGSGTWSRTPEQLYFFKTSDIERYSLLQRQIIENILPHLAPGGKLLYITCSVFKKENEEVVEFMNDSLQLMVETSVLLKGYDLGADSMFVAILSKSLNS